MRRPGLALKLSALLSMGVVGTMLADFVLSPPGDGADTRARVLLFVCVALGLALVAAFVLDLLVIRPLGRLARHARTLDDRSFADPFPVSGQDEPRELGEALERMRLTVVADREALQTLNAALEVRIEERSAALASAQRALLEKERLAAVGRLAAGVAHEVNNPAGVILGRVSLLLDEPEGLSPALIEDLRVVERQARRIREITGSLLTLGRPASGKRVVGDLAEVAQAALDLVRRESEAAGVTLVVDLQDAPLACDPAALEQVAYNLLRNAVQAAPGGTVHVRTGPEGLVVEDSGAGIPAEVLPRLFDPFFTTKPVGEGTGLGLAVAHGIVTDHNGRIYAENRREGGARFVVQIGVVQGSEHGPHPRD